MNKQVFCGNTFFDIAEYPVEIEPPIFSKRFYVSGEYRDSIRLTILGSYEEVKTEFYFGVSWGIREYDLDEQGNVLETYLDYDKSDYCVLGDIVDHGNGSISIYMGKMTEKEIALAENASLQERVSALENEVSAASMALDIIEGVTA